MTNYTYPLPASQLPTVTAVEAAGFLKNPLLIARRLSELITEDKLMSYYLLSGRWQIVGGALMVESEVADETADLTTEAVAPGAEYSTITLSEAERRLVTAQKRGAMRRITDEGVTRSAMDVVNRNLTGLANKVIRDWESLSMSVIQSAGLGSFTSAPWADGDTIITAVETAKAEMVGLGKDFNPSVLVITDAQWAKIATAIKDMLPSNDNTIAMGGFPQTLGLSWVRSQYLPKNWVPTLFDRDYFGGIGHETILSEGYVSIGNGLAEVKRERSLNVDGTDITVRKTDVPVIRNADAGMRILGAL